MMTGGTILFHSRYRYCVALILLISTSLVHAYDQTMAPQYEASNGTFSTCEAAIDHNVDLNNAADSFTRVRVTGCGWHQFDQTNFSARVDRISPTPITHLTYHANPVCTATYTFSATDLLCHRENGEPAPTCEQGAQYHWQDSAPPPQNNLCANGCEYLLGPQSGNPDIPGGVMNQGDGIWTGVAVGSGNTCTPDVAPPSTSGECVIDDSGHAICFTQSSDCTTFDGGEFCVHDVPQGAGCVYNEKGFLCTPGTTPPPDTTGTTPTKDGTMKGDNNGDGTLEVGDVYNTWNNTQGGGGGGGGGCGGPGEVPCKIDETGTPTSTGNDYSAKADSFMEELTTFMNSQGGNELGSGATSWDDFNPLPDVPGSGCASVDFSIGGHNFSFPATQGGCDKLATLRQYLSWILYIMTAFYLFGLAMRKPI